MKETLPAIYIDGVLKLEHPLDWLENNRQVHVTVIVPDKVHPLDKCVGIMPDEDANEMRRIIADEFDRIEPDDWK